MSVQFKIVDESPFDDGQQAGRKLGRDRLRSQTRALLDGPLLKGDLGAMSETALLRQVAVRLHAVPNDGAKPELAEIYPDRLDYLRGLAKGAGCTLQQAAAYDFVSYTREIRHWHAAMNPPPPGSPALVAPGSRPNCSGILFVGPEGVIGGQNIDSLPPSQPAGYRHRRPPAFKGLAQRPAPPPPGGKTIILKRPRSGYIEEWGTTNEHGLGLIGGGSCGTWLDEPIEDVWPIKNVPFTRFARNVRELEKLAIRYRLYDWGRYSAIWADIHGGGLVLEKSYRRVGVRRMEDGAIWATEGHFQEVKMAAFLRERRLKYVRQIGQHLGVDDLQYATDCAVRFCHIGEVAHRDLGRGLDHMRRLVTDHAPFPRAICRHAGPDTDKYDATVTLQSTVTDMTRNCVYQRTWQPWKRFSCEMPEVVTQYPPRPCDA